MCTCQLKLGLHVSAGPGLQPAPCSCASARGGGRCAPPARPPLPRPPASAPPPAAALAQLGIERNARLCIKGQPREQTFQVTLQGSGGDCLSRRSAQQRCSAQPESSVSSKELTGTWLVLHACCSWLGCAGGPLCRGSRSRATRRSRRASSSESTAPPALTMGAPTALCIASQGDPEMLHVISPVPGIAYCNRIRQSREAEMHKINQALSGPLTIMQC